MAEFSLRIVASDKVFYGGPSEIVIVPALDGEYGFMAHHDDMVVAMKPGELRFKKPDGTWEYAVVGGGVAQSANNRVTILVDSAERPEDIDEVRAREAMERAQEQLRQKQSIYEYRMSKASLARAVSRLKENGSQSVKAEELRKNLWHLRLQEKEKLPCLYQRGAGMGVFRVFQVKTGRRYTFFYYIIERNKALAAEEIRRFA